MTTLPQDLAAVQTLPELLAYRAARTPNAPAYQAFDPSLQSWQTLSWAQAAQRVDGLKARRNPASGRACSWMAACACRWKAGVAPPAACWPTTRAPYPQQQREASIIGRSHHDKGCRPAMQPAHR